MYTSRYVHFHCYSLSVVAALIAVILIVQVSTHSPRSMWSGFTLLPLPALPPGGLLQLPTVYPNSCLSSLSPDIFSIVLCVGSLYIPLTTSIYGYAPDSI